MDFEAVVEPVKGTIMPRKDAMCRVRITSRTEGQVIPGGHVIPAGTHTAVVYAADVPTLQELFVQTDVDKEDLRDAELAFNRRLRGSVKMELDARVMMDAEGKPDENSEETKAILKKAREQYAGSIEAVYFERTGRDVKPFSSLEVIERDLVAPAAKIQSDLQTMTAQIVANTVKGQSGNTAEIVSGVIAELVKAGVIKVSPNEQQQKR